MVFGVPEGEDVVNESFPDERPVKLLFKIFVSNLAMKILAKATAILVPMAAPCILGSFVHYIGRSSPLR